MNDEQKKIIGELACSVLEHAGFSVSSIWSEGPMDMLSLIGTEDLTPLIGKDGQSLVALEHVIRLAAFRKFGGTERLPDFLLDINGYRKEQNARLAQIAEDSAQRVIASGKAEALAPMNAYERRIVHTKLATYQQISTESIGAEPNRRVVIKPSSSA